VEQQLIGMAVVVAVTIALCVVMGGKDSSAKRDRTRISERYRLKGVTVLGFRFVGRDPYSRRGGMGPVIRRYEVEVEEADHGREMRMIGIEETLRGEPKFWRYDQSGAKHPML